MPNFGYAATVSYVIVVIVAILSFLQFWIARDRRPRRSHDRASDFRRGIVYLLLSIAAFVSVFPFYWMIVGATNTSIDIVRGKATSARPVRQYRRPSSISGRCAA